MADGADSIIFVGGAPRSGTTVAHALICTGDDVSAYAPEISFFRGFMSAFRNGRAAWDQHTSAYFRDRDDFRDLIRETSDLALRRIWTALGGRSILAVKDPHLTPFFPDLNLLYPDKARFVTVCRHPYDVVRSRQEVHDKSGLGRPFTVGDASAVAREYVSYYQAVLRHGFGGRHFMFRYEDLNSDGLRARLAAFAGLQGFDTSRMWGASADKVDDDAWGSPKYNRAIDLTSRLSPLAPEFREGVAAICAPIMQRMGYQP
ncbi:sulfotransferase [Phenylobacterium sp.]|uniref:sulfotransferase n=1 Tax=Phenylobacterium sp. TaxID=1871053 RepID=UPI0025EF184F|nr:sulfotransferase [Phenylobacterium sp.]MBX3482845.1 sulfotransferase [Phenylobacterium sp.]MCW5758298.1 sulfotransferase [Phenylobacterium sp.]